MTRFVLAFLVLATSVQVAAQTVSVDIPLGAAGADMEADPARGLVYVSVPSSNEVLYVSTTTFQVVDRVVVGSLPRGMDLSHDGSRLFIALNGSGSVAILDLSTRQVTSIDVSTQLGHAATWDVDEAQPDRLFVSANPGSSGFAWIVQVLLAQGNAASRVANNSIIRANPIFETSRAGDFLL